MYNESKALFLKVLTPLHAGSGTDLRAVDLPIQREVHTGFPKIEASTLKGCIRNSFEKSITDNSTDNKIDKETLNLIFGNEEKDKISAAAIAITDARLLFFPVRSAKGIYALITCPMVLNRFKKDMELLEKDKELKKKDNELVNKVMELVKMEIDKLEDVAPALASQESVLTLKTTNDIHTVLLDEYRYDLMYNSLFLEFCKKLEEIGQLDISKRAVLLPNDDFKDFVMHATSIVTRIKVGNSGVVENQALFTEEFLPEESILYSLVMMSDSKDKSKGISQDNSQNTSRDNSSNAQTLMKAFSSIFYNNKIFQIGADETLGKGFVETFYIEGGDRHE